MRENNNNTGKILVENVAVAYENCPGTDECVYLVRNVVAARLLLLAYLGSEKTRSRQAGSSRVCSEMQYAFIAQM